MNGLAGYAIEAPVGTGAMGTVYRARQVGSGRRLVALKRVRAGGDRALVQRLRHEGEVLARLDHPHIVRVYELLADGDGIAIAMQYAPGGSLADLLSRRGRLTPDELVAVAAPVADALASAHRRGVLHRDVKPANILFTSDGEPLLTDFGIACWERAAPLTAPDAVPPGTAEYLDPEVADGASPDARSDVYALGVVCYEALTGRRPFTGPTPLAVLRAADRARMAPIDELAPAVPAGLVQGVHRALARDPARRFADAAALSAALRAACPAAARARLALAAAAVVPPPPPALGAPEGPPTRDYGPRPPRPPVEAPPRALPKAAVGLVALALVLVPPALAAGVARGAASPPQGPAVWPSPGPDRRPPAAAELQPPCPPAHAPPAGPGTRVVIGDLDGDGCPSGAAWRGNVLEVTSPTEAAPVRYELGRPGDLLVLGDWDCDGADTPGLYRPGTGELFLFDGWASVAATVRSRPARDSGTIGGHPRVVHRGGCDDVEIVASAGRSSSLADAGSSASNGRRASGG